MSLLIYPPTSFFVVQVLFTGADFSTKSNTVLDNHISWTGKTLWKLHSAMNRYKHRSLEKNSINHLLCHQLPYSNEIKSTWSTNKFTCSMEGRSGLKYQEHMMMETRWRNWTEHTDKKIIPMSSWSIGETISWFLYGLRSSSCSADAGGDCHISKTHQS